MSKNRLSSTTSFQPYCFVSHPSEAKISSKIEKSIHQTLQTYPDENNNNHINEPNKPSKLPQQIPRTTTLLKGNTTVPASERVFGRILNPQQPVYHLTHTINPKTNTKSIDSIPDIAIQKQNHKQHIVTPQIQLDQSVNNTPRFKEIESSSFQPTRILEVNIPSVPCVNSFDSRFASNPQYVSEIAQDVFSQLFQHQNRFLCRDQVDFHDMHPQLDESMRCVLIDWLLEVCMKHEFKAETFFTAVQLLDIYCRLAFQSRLVIARMSFQQIGICCLRIAAKMEEIYPPPIESFTELCDNAYSTNQLIQAEIDICVRTSFDLTFPTPYTFYLRYSAILTQTPAQIKLGIWIVHACCMPYNLSTIYVRPSVLACISAYIVENITEAEWDSRISDLNHIQEFHASSELQQFVPQLLKVLDYFRNPDGPFSGIRKKYATLNFT